MGKQRGGETLTEGRSKARRRSERAVELLLRSLQAAGGLDKFPLAWYNLLDGVELNSNWGGQDERRKKGGEDRREADA